MVECIHVVLHEERHGWNVGPRKIYAKYDIEVSLFNFNVMLLLANTMILIIFIFDRENNIPKPIWNSVRRSNIAFSHNQDQFSLEHFNFMKKLCCMRLQVLPGSQSAVWVSRIFIIFI